MSAACRLACLRVKIFKMLMGTICPKEVANVEKQHALSAYYRTGSSSGKP
jgi:hypothetical protein